MIVAALVIVSYWPVRHYGFVRYDDPDYVSENPHIKQGLTWHAVSWSLTSGYASNWHPLTWVSHMVDVQLFGVNAGAHHVTNVVLHLVTTLLLFLALARMTGAVWRSVFVAGLFALHPLHVESVAWIAERKDVLSALCWMATILAYVGYARDPRLRRYLLVAACFALGLMAKPMVVTLPFVLLLLDFWPLRRLSFAGGHQTLRALLVEKIPLFALSVASSVITFAVQREGGSVAPVTRLPLLNRVENAVISYVAYLEKAVWPSHLAIYYPYPKSFSILLVMGCALLLAAISAVAILRARRYPYVAVGWFWYLGTLVPVIGLVQVGAQARADRYTYIPLIGIFLIVAWGIPDLLRRWSLHKFAIAVAGAGILALSAFASTVQVRHWASNSELWTHAIDVTTDNDVAHNNLGPDLAAAGKLDEAVAHFREAIRINPTYADAHSNLGLALASQRRLGEAVLHYREAIRLFPGHARAHANLAVALQALGRTDDAIRELEAALKLNPDNARVRAALAILKGRAR